jgi:molybdopterin converting factor small subunit
MEIRIKYFGMLSELVGKDHEIMVLEPGSNAMELKEQLFDKYSELKNYDYKLAINLDLIDGNPELKNNDEVAFLPPYAGG